MKPTSAQLRAILHYNPLTGVLRWKVDRGRAKAGSVAGSPSNVGSKHITYLRIRVLGHLDYAHRIAWCIKTGEWPKGLIDHRDRNGTNNKWNNLRLATHSQNLANGIIQSHNTSGFKGVSWFSRDKKWRVQIKVKGKQTHIGYFDTKEEAHEAYKKAALELHGEFARFK